MKTILLAAALVLVPTVTYAACPTGAEQVTGTNAANVLRGKVAGKKTCFRGRAGRDTFVVEKPQFFNPFGSDRRDHWDVIMDFERREIVEVPGTPISYRVSGCRIWWEQGGANTWFVILDNCPSITKADVVVR